MSDLYDDYDDHKDYVGLSWTDESVTLVCRRDECLETHVGAKWRYWWQRELPYMCSPEAAVEWRDKHLKGEDWR